MTDFHAPEVGTQLPALTLVMVGLAPVIILIRRSGRR